MHVAIAGNIGAGKTTLTKLLPLGTSIRRCFRKSLFRRLLQPDGTLVV